MATEKHYFIEQNPDGKYAVKAKGANRSSGLFDTQNQAESYANKLNFGDHPDVERVKNVTTGGRDQWRAERKKDQ